MAKEGGKLLLRKTDGIRKWHQSIEVKIQIDILNLKKGTFGAKNYL
jgi:hypothetical protein